MNQTEIDVAEYLLHHGESLKEFILERSCPTFGNLPIDSYEQSLLNEFKFELVKNLRLSYEEIDLIVTRKFVTLLLGINFLDLKKE